MNKTDNKCKTELLKYCFHLVLSIIIKFFIIKGISHWKRRGLCGAVTPIAIQAKYRVLASIIRNKYIV